MNKKAILYPFSAEETPLTKYAHLVKSYNILAVSFPGGLEIAKKDVIYCSDQNEMKAISESEINPADFDALIIANEPQKP